MMIGIAQFRLELNRFGIKHIKKEEYENLKLDEELDGRTEIKYHINDIIIRTISKIGFNYLAYCLGYNFVLNGNFNSIRRYIRFGTQGDQPEFIVNGNSILFDEPKKGFRKLGHIIVLEWGRGCLDIKMRVSLYNNFTYEVTLSKNYSGIFFDLRNGHIFNINNKEINRLSHTNIQLLP